MEALSVAPVRFSPFAVSEINRLMREPKFEQGQVLKVGVKGGGCSGMTYVLEFGNLDEELEVVYETEGITVAMQPAHEMYLYGMEVDFQDGLNARGFVFRNPNATKTCGCGTSFSV
jgi:iron-sulfur cluster assembly accessory protein